MNLYSINAQLERLLELEDERSVDTETGEILTAEEVDALNMSREEKIENCLLFVKNKTAEAEMLSKEIEALTARKRAAENKAKWTKEYVQGFLNGEKFSTPKVQVSYRKSKAVDIRADIKIENLPEEFIKIKYEPNKTLLKAAIEKGQEIDGVSIVERQSMVIK